MALTSGTKLGPYEIVAPLGAGGMGEVYRARDTRLDRTVAVKILPSHLSSNPEARQRFDREARAISSLNHPNICTLYDVGHQDGMGFIVMEYLEGETLADRLMKGPLRPEQVLKYGVEICEGLERAHKTGVIHRDLKPGNIMLTKTGAKLMDFGLAKATTANATPASSLTMTLSGPPEDRPLTARGMVVGTFQYMSPEQVEGKEADARSDIFALGAVLYEMATGKRAFTGKSQASIIAAILASDPQPISTVQPMSPPALDRVVKICLAKDPDERMQTAHDVKLQLQWIAEGGSQAGIPVPARRRLRLGWPAAGFATLVALVAAAAYVNLALHQGPVVRSSILPPAGTSFAMASNASGPPVLAPDGTRLAFTARDDKGKVLLYVRPLNSMTAQALTGTEDAMYPFWSPDSREVGFFVEGKLKKIDANANGGPPQPVCDADNGRGGAWGRDGVIVFNPSPARPLLRVSAAGGPTEPASKLDVSRGENTHRWPYFLPDGKHFLFWARSSRGIQDDALYVGALGSSQARLLMKSESMAVYASGYLLFMRDQTLMAQPFSPRRLEMTGEPVPIAEHVAINQSTSRPLFSASETGALVYRAGDTAGGWSISWFGRDGRQIGSVAQMDRYFSPVLSPDGTHLATTVFGAWGTGSIWTFDLLRGSKTRLTFGPSLQQSAVWTPDGKTIFYASSPQGAPHIYAKAADGSGSERVVLESSDAAVEVPASSSPDGHYLAYVRRSLSGTQTSLGIWVLPLIGGGKPFPIVQTVFDDSKPAISPDGKWMAYQTNETGRMEVYITAFPGGGAKWQVSTNGGADSEWRRDGKEMFFLDTGDNMMAVDVNTSSNAVRLGVPHALFHLVALQRQTRSYDVTADGKKFLFNSGNLKEGSEPLTLVLNWPAELKK